MSMQALHLQRPREAVTLAQAAQQHATGRGGPRLRALLAVREARGWADLGDPAAVDASLGRATDDLYGRPSGRDPDWVEFFDDVELAGAAGHCYVNLGMGQRGIEKLRKSVATQGGSRTRNTVSWTLALADGLARTGQPAEACTVAGDALPLLSELSSSRVHRQLHTLRRRVEPHTAIAEVRDFRQRTAVLPLPT
jgi:hypothetical protein